MDPIQIVADLTARATAVSLSMAEACRMAGMAPSTPSRWKSGTFEPRMKNLRKLEGVIAEAEARHAASAAGTQ